MSKRSFNKLAAVAALAVVGLSSSAYTNAAATYFNNFDTTGQAAPTQYGTGSTGAVTPAVGTGGSNGFSIATTPGGSINDYFLPIAGFTGTKIVSVSFSLDRATPESTGPTAPITAGFGIDATDAAGNNIASLYVRSTNNTGATPPGAPVPALYVSTPATDVPDQEVFGPAGNAETNGNYGTYTLTLNFNTDKFYVANPAGITSGPYAFDTDTGESGSFGGVGLGTDNANLSSVGVFDNIRAVPEPASIGMIAAGSLLLMARRRKATVA